MGRVLGGAQMKVSSIFLEHVLKLTLPVVLILLFVGLNTLNDVFRFAKYSYFYIIKKWQKI